MSRRFSPPMLLATLAFLSFVTPAFAGDFFPQVDCDSTSAPPPETLVDFLIWPHGMPNVCRLELRPVPDSRYNLPAVPILDCVAPQDWTWAWIDGVPGAIVLHGCVDQWAISPPITILIGSRAAEFDAALYDDTGTPLLDRSALFYCGSAPVPSLPASWGRLKAAYR